MIITGNGYDLQDKWVDKSLEDILIAIQHSEDDRIDDVYDLARIFKKLDDDEKFICMSLIAGYKKLEICLLLGYTKKDKNGYISQVKLTRKLKNIGKKIQDN